MTSTLKTVKTSNGYSVSVEIEKFSCIFQVITVNPYGSVIRRDFYYTREQAEKAANRKARYIGKNK